MFVNTAKWAELPKSYQAIAANAAHHGNTYMQARYDAVNPAAIKRLVAAGAQLRPFSPEILEASYKAAQEVYAETSAEQRRLQDALRPLMPFRDDGFLWWQVAEYSFDSFSIRSRSKA